MNYFVKGYEGELEPDAIREAATEAGFLAVEAAPQEQVSDANAEAVAYAQQRVMAASAGATSEDISEAAALARMEAAMQEGGIEAMLDVARQYGIPTNAEY
jgi:DNA-binding PucR family transcriptional regulator